MVESQVDEMFVPTPAIWIGIETGSDGERDAVGTGSLQYLPSVSGGCKMKVTPGARS